MGGGIPLWVWLVAGGSVVLLVLIVLAIKGYPEDGSF